MKKIIILSTLIIMLSANSLHAELLAIDQYLSVKTGYTGTFVDPAKLKGVALSPATGISKNTLLSTANLSVAMGTYYATTFVAIRGELEYTIRFESSNTIPNIAFSNGEQGSLLFRSTIHSTLVNLYLDFNTTTFFVPYIGVGLGASFIDSKFSIPNYSKKDLTIDFAWMATIGGAFYIIPSIALDIQVRYTALGNAKYGSGEQHARLLSTLNAVEAMIGIRYTL